MINTVRNTVMAVLNKDNNGYVTPQEFNLFAKQAQLKIFEDYFYAYNHWVTKKNGMFRHHMRQSNSGYADIPKQLAEVIDTFSLESGALANAANVFTLPTDWYDLITVNYNKHRGREGVAEQNTQPVIFQPYRPHHLLSCVCS